MKQKITTITLTIIAALVPVLMLPLIITNSTYFLKLWTMYICGAILFISLIINYKKIKTDKKDILLYIFLGLLFISTCLSSDIKISIFGFNYRHEGLLMFLIYGCIYLCTKNFYTIENYKEVLNLFFYIYLAIGILGITERYVDYFVLYPIFSKGISSTFGNPNFFGSFMCIVLPISICIHIFNGNKKAFILSIVMFFNVISAATRSAWVAMFCVIVGIIIYLIKTKKKVEFKRFFILFICFALIGIYLFGGFNFIKNKIYKAPESEKKVVSQVDRKTEQMKTEFEKAKETKGINKFGSSRIELWTHAIRVIKGAPIFGCGPDNLNNGIAKYSFEDREYEEYIKIKYIDKAHNEYLQIAATCGIPALIVYLAFLCAIIFSKSKIVFKDKAVFMIGLAICSYLTQAFFNISVIAVAPLFWMLLGLIDNKEMIEILNRGVEVEKENN